MSIAHSLPEHPVHLEWALHLLLISVYQRSSAVSNLQFGGSQRCAVNGYEIKGLGPPSSSTSRKP